MDKLLIVDKNEKNLDLISNLLSDANYSIYTAQTGKIAKAKIKMLQPDLILLDSDLIDMSGFDVCKAIKSEQETKYCLVLMILSVETKDYILRALHVGADDYLIKNFDRTILLSKVKSLLRVKYLSDRITTQYSELKEKNELLNFQLKMAKQVQRSMIKEIDTSLGNIQIMSKYLPALDIGGDFFDAKLIDENHVGIILADVSGHGISAALLTSMLGLMFNTLLNNFSKPNEFLMAMNDQFCSIFDGSNTQMYACVFYAIFDIQEKKMLYSNAGQSYPLFYHAEDNHTSELQLGGVPIGVLPNTSYINKSIRYNSGDYIFFHTDGLSDFYYKDKPEEFSEKLREIFIYCIENTPNDLSLIIENVLKEFYEYNEEKKFQYDDVSLILCKL